MADHRLITYDELDRIDHTDLEEMPAEEVASLAGLFKGRMYIVPGVADYMCALVGGHFSYSSIFPLRVSGDNMTWFGQDELMASIQRQRRELAMGEEDGWVMVEFTSGHNEQGKVRLRIHKLEDEWYLAVVIKRSSMGGFPERVGEPRYFSYLCDQEHGLIEAVGAHLPEMLR